MEKASKKILVVGSGLAGLSIAEKLTQAGHQVTVVESRELAGGRYRRARTDAPYEVPDLGFFPADDEHLKALESFNREMGMQLLGEVREHQPITHHHAEWRDFVGFGDDPATSISILSQLNVQRELVIKPGFERAVNLLVDRATYPIRTRAEVTDFEFDDKHHITGVIINGAEKMAVDEIVFCPSPTRLIDLIPGDQLKPAARAKLARSTGFAAITLRIKHSYPLSNNPDLRILLGTGKEFEPAIGRESEQVSTWFSLVPSEKLHEEEAIGGQIRAIKRVLRRHWPEVLDSANGESIYVQEQAYGALDVKIKIGNLHLANHRFSNLIGSLAEWDAAQVVINDLIPKTEDGVRQLPVEAAEDVEADA